MSTAIPVTREEIHRQINLLPEEKLPAIRDILALLSGELLTSSSLEALECALMSSSALSRELNTPEEDEAWKDFNQETESLLDSSLRTQVRQRIDLRS